MIVPAMYAFFISFGGVVLLFAIKRLELNREYRFAEGIRLYADRGALRVKGWIEVSEYYLGLTPWFLSALTRYGIHIGALSFARLARTSAEQAHRLADLVSHKRGFERRETRSEYLRQVSETTIQEAISVPSQMQNVEEPIYVEAPQPVQSVVPSPVTPKRRRKKNGDVATL